MKAGVLEDGERIVQEVGTVQGGSISPLLANIYLHSVFDLWVQQWRRREAGGNMVVVRFADDFVLGFQYHPEAEQFLDELRERLAQHGLALHPEKTRLIQFGRFAAQERSRWGLGKPETFNFLGFTHICGRTRQGNFFALIRRTMRQCTQAKLREVKEELRQRMHQPIPEQGRLCSTVVRGHMRYYGLPLNGDAISRFRAVCCMRGAVERPFKAGPCPMTELQWERMAQATAKICWAYNISVGPRTVLAYGEVQKHLGIQQMGKWDPLARPWLERPLEGAGEAFRERVLAYMAERPAPKMSILPVG